MYKKYIVFTLVLLACGLVINQNVIAQPASSMLNKKAAAFSAKASLDGNIFHFSLKKALAKGPVVVYFYPAAYTGGCDLEAHTFADMKEQFSKVGATIIGVSADKIKRLKSFSSDPDYCAGKFPVASDPKGKIAATYGLKLSPPRPGIKDVRGEKVDHGFLPRTTFVINEKGKIVAVFSSKKDGISPDEHVKEALKIVKKL